MRKLNLRERRILTGGGLVAAIVLVFFYVVEPFNIARVAILGELENKTDLLHKSIQLIGQKDYFRARNEEISQGLLHYEGQFLNASNPSAATSELELTVRELASQLGVTISRSNPLQERNMEDRFAKITLQIHLEGNIGQLVSFVYALSSHPKFLLVEDLFLTSYRLKNQIRLRPRMNVSGLIQLSEGKDIST